MFRFELPPSEAAIRFVKSQVCVIKLRSPIKEEKCSTYELHRIQLLISSCSVVSSDMKNIPY